MGTELWKFIERKMSVTEEETGFSANEFLGKYELRYRALSAMMTIDSIVEDGG